MGAIASAWAWRRRVFSTAAMPPSRSCFKFQGAIQFDQIHFSCSLCLVVNEVGVLHEFTNQGIDLLQNQWGLGAAFQIASDKAVFLYAHLKRSCTGSIDSSGTELLGQGKDAQDAAHTHLSLLAMDGVAERTAVGSGPTGPPQLLGSAKWCPLCPVFFLDPIPAAFLSHMFAQQLTSFRVEKADVQRAPPDLRLQPSVITESGCAGTCGSRDHAPSGR
jgi:hypothetical protein